VDAIDPDRVWRPSLHNGVQRNMRTAVEKIAKSENALFAARLRAHTVFFNVIREPISSGRLEHSARSRHHAAGRCRSAREFGDFMVRSCRTSISTCST